MAKVKLIQVSGNYYEVGLQIGAALKNGIKKAVKIPHKENLLYNLDLDTKFMKCLPYANKYSPNLINEMKGMADGSNQSFEDLFLLNMEELWDNPPEKCTSIIHKTKDEVNLYHNEDFREEYKNEVAILKCKLKKVSFLSVIFPGLLAGSSVSLNSYGLVQSINSLNYHKVKIGVPKNFIAREILECRNINEVLKVIKTKNRASGYNHIIIDRNKVYNIETTPTNYEIREIKNEIFAHTNHYLSNNLTKCDLASKNSYQRLNLIKEATEGKEISKDLILSILKSHKENSRICKHNPKIEDITLTSVIAKPGELKLYATKGNPCRNKYFEYALNGNPIKKKLIKIPIINRPKQKNLILD
ncbi:hypothetical protein J4440_06440 [Candidatus Woesearchaeota archaeon]|nr:hypothetical protein [Candidatus Woesearchaeota archaeon]